MEKEFIIEGEVSANDIPSVFTIPGVTLIVCNSKVSKQGITTKKYMCTFICTLSGFTTLCVEPLVHVTKVRVMSASSLYEKQCYHKIAEILHARLASALRQHNKEEN